MPTPVRTVRVPDELWERALAAAEANDDNLSRVMVAALTRYVRTHERKTETTTTTA